MSEDGRLALVRELERADGEVAALLAELDELYAATEAVRAQALRLEAFFARLPAEREAAAEGISVTARRLLESRQAAVRTEAELRAAEADGDAERLAAARRLHVRAHDATAVAARKAEEAARAAASLEERAGTADAEAEDSERRARDLSSALRHRPRLAADAGGAPRPGLEGVSEWAARARAALLVARTSLAVERDDLIRQANELAAAVLGEPLTASGTAALARRLTGGLERP